MAAPRRRAFFRKPLRRNPPRAGHPPRRAGAAPSPTRGREPPASASATPPRANAAIRTGVFRGGALAKHADAAGVPFRWPPMPTPPVSHSDGRQLTLQPRAPATSLSPASPSLGRPARPLKTTTTSLSRPSSGVTSASSPSTYPDRTPPSTTPPSTTWSPLSAASPAPPAAPRRPSPQHRRHPASQQGGQRGAPPPAGKGGGAPRREAILRQGAAGVRPIRDQRPHSASAGQSVSGLCSRPRLQGTPGLGLGHRHQRGHSGIRRHFHRDGHCRDDGPNDTTAQLRESPSSPSLPSPPRG